MPVGERHDGHTAHGVPDEHHRALRHERLDDRVQVVAELVDRRALRRAAARAAVAALVEQDEPVVVAQRLALVVPAVHVEAVAVAQDHGERRARIAVDFGVQVDAVGRGDDVRLAAQHPVLADRVHLGFRAAADPADRHALYGHPGRGADREHADGRAEDPGSARRVGSRGGVAHAHDPQQ
jgi:hypothetical protein